MLACCEDFLGRANERKRKAPKRLLQSAELSALVIGETSTLAQHHSHWVVGAAHPECAARTYATCRPLACAETPCEGGRHAHRMRPTDPPARKKACNRSSTIRKLGPAMVTATSFF